MQLVHSVAMPPVPYFPGKHARHSVSRVPLQGSATWCPRGQRKHAAHDALADLTWKLTPGSQDSQSFALPPVPNLPGVQAMHAVS